MRHAALIYLVTIGLFTAASPLFGDDSFLVFATHFELKMVKVNPGANVSARNEASKLVLHVDVDHNHPFPGIESRSGGKGFLSNFVYGEAKVRNPADHAIGIEMRVDNPNADGLFHCCTESIDLAPHASGTLRVH